MNRRVNFVAGSLVVVLLLLSIPVQQVIARQRADEPLKAVLYIHSAETAKRLSLGYTGLLADIYWTRVVQYFGARHHVRAKEYELLAPLLDITTTLDPHMEVAYRFGSTFLAQRPPEGAGDPEAAIRLTERGIQNNPKIWRLYYHLGFIYWQELHDPHKASEAFLKGSQIPGALPWMRVMAAALAQSGGDRQTARFLWTNILRDSDDKLIRSNATKRLRALDSDEAVEILQSYVDSYKRQSGRQAQGWAELIDAGAFHGIPRDPMGNPYEIHYGRVEVHDPADFPFITRGLPPGTMPSVIPR